MSDWKSQPEPPRTRAEGEQLSNTNLPSSSKSKSKKSTNSKSNAPLNPNPIASTSTSTRLDVGSRVFGGVRATTKATIKQRPSVLKYPLRSSAANIQIQKKKAPNPSTMTLSTPRPSVTVTRVSVDSRHPPRTPATVTTVTAPGAAAEMNDATFQAVSRTMKILEDESAAAGVEAAIYSGSSSGPAPKSSLGSKTKVTVTVTAKAAGGRQQREVQKKDGEKGLTGGLTNEAEAGVEKKSEVKQKLKDKLARSFSRKLTGTESGATDTLKSTLKLAPMSKPVSLAVAVTKSKQAPAAAPPAPKQGLSKPKSLRSTPSASPAAAVVGAPSPAAAAAARVRARNGNRNRGVQFSGVSRHQVPDSDNADTDVDGDSPPSPGRSASRMMAAARVRYLNTATEGFSTRFHFNKKLRPKTPAKKKVNLQLQVKPTQSSFKKLVPSPREKRQVRERQVRERQVREGQGERQLRDDKYYVPTPYKFHASESSQSQLQEPPPEPSVTIEYKNPKSLSAFQSEMEAMYDADGDRDTSTLGSSTISVFQAQDAREEIKSKKTKSKAKASTNTKIKDKDDLSKPKLKPVKSMKSDTPTALLLGPKPDLSSTSKMKPKPPAAAPARRTGPKQLTPFCTTCKKNPTIHSSPVLMAEFTATLERLRTKIQDVKLREAAVAALDTKIKARDQELKDWQAQVETAAPTAKEKRLKLKKETLMAKIEETEVALRKFADLEANARDRVENRLRIQPVAVLEDLRTSESLQDNAYLQETLVHFFELLKLCEGSMHDDWLDAGFVRKVRELDAELGKRLGVKDKTPKEDAGAGEDLELNVEPRGCHSAVGHSHSHSGEPATDTAREPSLKSNDCLDPNSNLNNVGAASRPKST